MCCSFLSGAQHPWAKEKNEEGIEVYTRLESDSEFKSFKAITILDATKEEIMQVLRDADHYADWYGFTKTSRLLEQRGNLQYNYVETVFPWPYKNRDMVYKMSIETSNESSTKVSLLGLPHYVPENKGIVRMLKAEGHMLLTTVGQNTAITYVFHSEPGTNVPAWLANSSIAELPYQTLLGLRTYLMRRKSIPDSEPE